MDDKEKDFYVTAKASKTWRTLRITSKSKLNLFDKVDDGKNLKVLFEAPPELKPEDSVENGDVSEKPTEIKDKENIEVPDTTIPETSEASVEGADAVVT